MSFQIWIVNFSKGKNAKHAIYKDKSPPALDIKTSTDWFMKKGVLLITCNTYLWLTTLSEIVYENLVDVVSSGNAILLALFIKSIW